MNTILYLLCGVLESPIKSDSLLAIYFNYHAYLSRVFKTGISRQNVIVAQV